MVNLVQKPLPKMIAATIIQRGYRQYRQTRQEAGISSKVISIFQYKTV